MLIIVEGCDGVGKTTLVNELANKLRREGDVTTLHRGVPEQHPLVEYEAELVDYVPSAGKHVICDRWHVGELVYADLYRDGSLLGGARGPGTWHVEAFLRSRGAVLVHLYATESVVIERLKERGEDYLKMDDVGHVLWAFTRATMTSDLPVIDVESKDDTLQAWVRRILKSARAFEREAQRFGDTPMYVGHPRPDVLLVGETINPSKCPEIMLPFVPFPATSGHFLFSAIRRDHTYGVTNALDEDVFTLWWKTLRPRVVALGKMAHSELNKLHIPHGVVPHPQYVRRFHNRRKIEYGGAIVNAAHGQKDLMTTWTS